MLKASVTKHRLQFKNPAGTSRGVLNWRDTWYINIFDSKSPNKIGIGEIAPLPGLSKELDANFEYHLETVCKHIDQLQDSYHRNLLEFPSIRFGVEMALTDLKNGAKKDLFHSSFTLGHDGIEINGLIWMGNYDSMFKQIEDRIAKGFTCIKLKIGAINFEDELKLLKHIRRSDLAKNIELRVDANGAFTPETTLEKLNRLADLNIHSIEQPIKAAQWDEMAELCDTSPIPIALDEELIGINSTERKKLLLATIRPQYIILKPSLTGGFMPSLEWIELAEENGIDWWITSALESDIGLNAIAQWTFTLNNPMPQGLGTGSMFTNNIPSPLSLKANRLFHNPEETWKLSEIYE